VTILAEGRHADGCASGAGSTTAPRPAKGVRAARLTERTAEFGEARIGAHELHRLAALGTDGVRARFDQSGREAHAVEVAHLREQAFGEALGVARGDLQAWLCRRSRC
jgi:hypothetical protein